MKKIGIIIICFLFYFSSSSLNAQEVEQKLINYKVTFLDIDQFQLKELVPVCSEIFDAIAGNKGGEPNVLRFNSNLNITEKQLQEKLKEYELNYSFTIEIE